MGISFLSRMCISSNIKPKQRIKMPLNAKYNKCKGMCVLWHSNSAEYSLLAPLARTFPAISKAGLLMLFLLILQGFFPIWTSFPSLWIYLALSQSHLFFFFFFWKVLTPCMPFSALQLHHHQPLTPFYKHKGAPASVTAICQGGKD